MKSCKWCGKKSWFFGIDRNSLCRDCRGNAELRILGNLTQVRSLKAVVNSKKPLMERLEAYEESIRLLRALLPYEEKGVPTCTPPPSQLIEVYVEGREEDLIGRRLSYSIFDEVLHVPKEYAEKADRRRWRSRERYVVSISDLTCSCPDFEKRRIHFPTTDLRRICKHIGWVFDDQGRPEGWSDLLYGIVRRGRGKRETYVTMPMASREEIAVGTDRGRWWLEVYARSRRRGERDGLYTGPYNHFGFNILEDRWSYGESPPGAREIRGMIWALAYRLGWIEDVEAAHSVYVAERD